MMHMFAGLETSVSSVEILSFKVFNNPTYSDNRKRGHMTTKECYERIGGDYEDALGRLMNEKLVKRFLFKFADATDMETLKNSLAAQDYETAFRMAHNLKGVCANLSISKLGTSSSDLCEELRDGKYTDKVEPLMTVVQADYDATVTAIRQLQAEEA